MPLSTRPLRLLAASASALVLGACATVGPNFKTPEGPKGPAAAGYAMAGDAVAPGVRLSPDARAAGPWWQAFGSPELDGAIRQALADSPTIGEARATLEKAQAQAAATRGAELPQVDANAGAQRERINTQSFGFTGFPSPTINLFSIGGAVRYDLDLFRGEKRAPGKGNAPAAGPPAPGAGGYPSLSGQKAHPARRSARPPAPRPPPRSASPSPTSIRISVCQAR